MREGLPQTGAAVARRGATLIEVLCALSILGVLAALALPPLAGARNRATQLQCLSNMRGVSQHLHAYASDARDMLPFYSWWTRPHDLPTGRRIYIGGRRGLMSGSWTVMLPEAWQGTQVHRAFMCSRQRPFDPDLAPSPGHLPSEAWLLPSFWMSSALWLDAATLRAGSTWDRVRPRPNGLHDVVFPSAKALLFEQIGFCVAEPGSDVWKHQIGQTFNYATSTALIDGSVRRLRRAAGLPSLFSMPFDSTTDGVRGRDID